MTPEEQQEARLKDAGIIIGEIQAYIAGPDSLGVVARGESIQAGYKRCGSCSEGKKLYLFNKSSATKLKCTGNCKSCQRTTAGKSYAKLKKAKDHKKHYQDNIEYKRAQHKKYYEKNKEIILEKQKAYHQTKEGKKVLSKSHAKRRALLKHNKGIKYQREWVIDRDKLDGPVPICYLCKKPINKARDIQLDHVIPVVIGGKDCFTNIACTHMVCNLRREKDARELSVEQVEFVITLAEEYMDKHIELFDPVT